SLGFFLKESCALELSWRKCLLRMGICSRHGCRYRIRDLSFSVGPRAIGRRTTGVCQRCDADAKVERVVLNALAKYAALSPDRFAPSAVLLPSSSGEADPPAQSVCAFTAFFRRNIPDESFHRRPRAFC